MSKDKVERGEEREEEWRKATAFSEDSSLLVSRTVVSARTVFFEAAITGISEPSWLCARLGLCLFTGSCLPPRANLSLFFLCRVLDASGLVVWMAGVPIDHALEKKKREREREREDIKDVCHAPPSPRQNKWM